MIREYSSKELGTFKYDDTEFEIKSVDNIGLAIPNYLKSNVTVRSSGNEAIRNNKRGVEYLSYIGDGKDVRLPYGCTNCKFMFTRYPYPICLDNFNTELVTNMFGMFNDYRGNINLKNFDTRNVVDMEYMFSNFVGSVDLEYLKTDSLKYMNRMFKFCEIPILDLYFFNTSRIESMMELFKDSIIGILNLTTLDTSCLTSMQGMFQRCTCEEIDVSNFNTKSITSMADMFAGCVCTNLNLGTIDTARVTTMRNMFGSCRCKGLDLRSLNTCSVKDMSFMFSNLTCDKLDLTNFYTGNVENMSFMFMDAKITNGIDLSSFDTSKVVQMVNMFEKYKGKLDLANFNTCNVTNISGMFSYCTSPLALYNFDTSKVTDMVEMFKGYKYKTLDISTFRLFNLKIVTQMFTDCKCKYLDVRPFNSMNDKEYYTDSFIRECKAVLFSNTLSYDSMGIRETEENRVIKKYQMLGKKIPILYRKLEENIEYVALYYNEIQMGYRISYKGLYFDVDINSGYTFKCSRRLNLNLVDGLLKSKDEIKGSLVVFNLLDYPYIIQEVTK